MQGDCARLECTQLPTGQTIYPKTGLQATEKKSRSVLARIYLGARGYGEGRGEAKGRENDEVK